MPGGFGDVMEIWGLGDLGLGLGYGKIEFQFGMETRGAFEGCMGIFRVLTEFGIMGKWKMTRKLSYIQAVCWDRVI